jgi:catalase
MVVSGTTELRWRQPRTIKGGQTMNNKLTTAFGAPVVDDNNIMTAGPRGPALLQDVWFLEKLAHFDREVIQSGACTRRVLAPSAPSR